MARARNIKPSFFKNDELAEIEPLGRLLFIGLWSLCDFKGELEWREKRVKAEILPYDNCNILELAINLDKSGFIRYYSSQGKMYINIPNFIKHQNPHVNERKKGSEIPSYSKEHRQAVELKGLVINRDKSGLIPEDSASDRADSCSLNPESFILNPEPCSLKTDIKPIFASDPDIASVIFEYWKAVMGKDNSVKPTTGRMSKIKARLKDGYTDEQIKSAIDGCKSSSHHMGKNDANKVYDCLTLICRSAEKLDMFIGYTKVINPESKRDQDLDNWANSSMPIQSQGEIYDHE